MKNVKALTDEHRDGIWDDANYDMWFYNTKRCRWECLYNEGEEGYKRAPKGQVRVPSSDLGPYTYGGPAAAMYIDFDDDEDQ